MYQVDTSLTMYALTQAEAVISQSNAIFDQMIDDTLEFNRAMVNLDFVEMTPAEFIGLMFPYSASGGMKKKSAQSKTASKTKATTRTPTSNDDLQLISGIGPRLEKKLHDAGITSYWQIATLTPAEIADLEANIVRFSGRIERDDWIAQAQTLMNT